MILSEFIKTETITEGETRETLHTKNWRSWSEWTKPILQKGKDRAATN